MSGRRKSSRKKRPASLFAHILQRLCDHEQWSWPSTNPVIPTIRSSTTLGSTSTDSTGTPSQTFACCWKDSVMDGPTLSRCGPCMPVMSTYAHLQELYNVQKSLVLHEATYSVLAALTSRVSSGGQNGTARARSRIKRPL